MKQIPHKRSSDNRAFHIFFILKIRNPRGEKERNYAIYDFCHNLSFCVPRIDKKNCWQTMSSVFRPDLSRMLNRPVL